MLVDVGISDISVNKEFGYSVGAYDASGRALTHDVVFSGTDFVLLRVRGAAKQKFVHIGVQVQEIGKLEEDLFNIANQLESKTAKIEEYRAAHGL